ncbi:MAG: hypothetical protein IKE46_09750 [Selenomonadaceae bacterium]|nr:hypothetical protein [Selenomonadaceae bacterium]
MKKNFLAGALTTCLLMTGCGNNSGNAETLDIKAKEVSIETFSVATGSDEIQMEEPPKVTKAGIDWSRAPRFDNYASLIEYLNDSKKNLQTYQPVVFVNGFNPDNNYVAKVRGFWTLRYTNYGNGCMLYEITNYPGERVAWAYLHNDTSFLSNEEKQLYNVAVQIVNEAKNFSSDALYQELYLHDAIIERATYYTEHPQKRFSRFQTATGALIDGKANCQGYTDAFYMLATMCGFKVDKVVGDSVNSAKNTWEGHTWNTISFDKYNTSYFVDVTWDDEVNNFNGEIFNGYIYFNTSTNVAGADHRWYSDNVPKNLPADPDGFNYYHYRAKEYNVKDEYFGGWCRSATDALQVIAERIARQGYGLSRMEAPYDNYYGNQSNAINYLKNLLSNSYGWRGRFSLISARRGNYMYITVRAY